MKNKCHSPLPWHTAFSVFREAGIDEEVTDAADADLKATRDDESGCAWSAGC